MSFHFHLATSLAKEEVEEPRKEPKGCNLSGWGGRAVLRLRIQNKSFLS